MSLEKEFKGIPLEKEEGVKGSYFDSFSNVLYLYGGKGNLYSLDVEETGEKRDFFEVKFDKSCLSPIISVSSLHKEKNVLVIVR